MKSTMLFIISLIVIATNAIAENVTINPQNIILTKHGNIEVTKLDFDAELYRIPEQQRTDFLTSPQRVLSLLKNLLTIKLLAQEARDRKINEDELIKKRLELAENRSLAEMWLERLVEEGLQKADLNALAQEYYQANPEKFQLPEQVHVSHILIGSQKQPKEQAKAQAEKVLVLVKEGKQSFADLAMEYSQDPSVKHNKGDLGFFGRGQMVKPFEEAAFAMQEAGEISPIIETEYGFHILRFEGRKAAHQQSFEEVKERLMQEAEQRQQAQIRQFHINRIRSLPDVEINQEAVDALIIRVDFQSSETESPKTETTVQPNPPTQ